MFLIKSTKVFLWLKIVLLLASAFAAYSMGYSSAEVKKELTIRNLELAYKQEKEKLQTQLTHVQQELYTTEKEWLEEETETEVVYRDKEKVTTKTVYKYVQDNNLSECRIGTGGMLQLNKALLTGVNAGEQEDKNK